jgi:hypothetical protein
MAWFYSAALARNYSVIDKRMSFLAAPARHEIHFWNISIGWRYRPVDEAEEKNLARTTSCSGNQIIDEDCE